MLEIMKKLRTIFTVILIASAIFMITSCEDANKQNENSLSKSVTISLSGVGNTGSRTLLPSEVVPPKSYTFTLEAVKLSENGTYVADTTRSVPVQSFDATEGNNYTIQGVAIGAYKVTVEGYNALKDDTNKTITMIGSTSDSTPFIVAPNNETNSVSIALQLISEGDDHTGSISVKFDWSKAGGAVAEATQDGGLYFELWLQNDNDNRFKAFGSRQNSEPGETSFTFTADGIPVTKGKSLFFKVYNAQGILILDNFISVTAQVYAGHTSVGDSNEPTVYEITNAMLNPAKNIYDVDWSYSDDTGKNATITWNNPMKRNGDSLLSSVSIIITENGSSTTVVDEEITIADKAVSSSYTFEGMEDNKVYTLKYQANHKSGLISPAVFADFELKKRVAVTGIEIDETNLPAEGTILSFGDNFQLSATIIPDNATVKKYTWEVGSEEVLINYQNSFMAKKPGISTITVRSVDNPNVTDTTSRSVKVRLAAPTNIQATAVDNGISVSWIAPNFASSYTILRKESSEASYTQIATNITDTTYLDGTVNATSSYTYKVIADASEYDVDSFKVTSLESEESNAIKIADSSINITVPSLANFKFDISGEGAQVVTPEKNAVYQLLKPIDGAVTYTWKIIYDKEEKILLTGTYEQAKICTITIDSAGFNESTVGSYNDLRLVVTDANGTEYSDTTTFNVIDVLDTGVTYELKEGAQKRLSTKLADGSARTVQINAQVVPSNATMTSITYESSDESIATVTQTGLVTFHNASNDNGSGVTITMTPSNGVAATVTFDVYEATISSHLELLNIVNTRFNQALFDCGWTDWWANSTAETYEWLSTDKTVGMRREAGVGENKVAYATFDNATIDGGYTISGTVHMESKDGGLFGPTPNGSAVGTDPLHVIGFNGSVNSNTITVTLPGNQGTADIVYSNVLITGNRSGSYGITFNKSVGTNCYDEEDVLQTCQNMPITDSNTSGVTRIATKTTE